MRIRSKNGELADFNHVAKVARHSMLQDQGRGVEHIVHKPAKALTRVKVTELRRRGSRFIHLHDFIKPQRARIEMFMNIDSFL